MSNQKDAPPSDEARAPAAKPATLLRHFQTVPLLRHMRLWQKLLCIVVVLLIPTLFLLRDFVSRASQDIVRTRNELCLDEHSRPLRVILENQVALRLGRAESEAGSSGPSATRVRRSKALWRNSIGCKHRAAAA